MRHLARAAAAVAVLLLVGLGVGARSQDQAPSPGQAPPAGQAPGQVAGQDELRAKGEVVFNIGGCANCHTAKDGPALAGGDPLVTPFGTFYAPNITPDPETGIGGWTLDQFKTAIRRGRDPEGWPYYPAFPYTSYTQITDDDAAALKAYLDSVPPVRRPSHEHELSFPYNQRWALYVWQFVFFSPGRFATDPAHDPQWNRGAYLVQAPGHCAQCHTPRNFAGALEESRAFAGAPNLVGKGRIPNISGDEAHGLGKWGTDDVVTLLKLGMTPEGDFVGGEMGKVVQHATGKLPDDDVHAIAVYIKSLPPTQ